MLACMVEVEQLDSIGKVETRATPYPIPEIRRENERPVGVIATALKAYPPCCRFGRDLPGA